MWWSLWWVWMLGAVALGMLEVLAPAQIFLGFAVGTAAVGFALLFGFQAGLPLLLIIGGVLSLVAWLAIRKLVGVRKGQVKVFHHDINED